MQETIEVVVNYCYSKGLKLSFALRQQCKYKQSGSIFTGEMIELDLRR